GAPPGGPSKSTWIRGWIRGSTWRVKSSLPVWTSSAVALEEASNKATQACSARFLPVMLPPRLRCSVDHLALRCPVREKPRRESIRDGLELPRLSRTQRGEADATHEGFEARVVAERCQ